MAEPPTPPLGPEDAPAERESARWQALLPRSQDPLFLLNQQRRLLNVNRAWEDLTGLCAAEVRGRACKRQASLESGSLDALLAALCPPPEVFEGRPGRVRRVLPGKTETRRCCDIDFLPLHDGKERLRILGKIIPVRLETPAERAPLPDKLLSLRERVNRRFGMHELDSQAPELERAAAQVRCASQVRIPVLILGEPGAGKEWIARTIHQQSLERERGFAALDCARLPGAVLAETLFGAGGLIRHTDLDMIYLREVARLPRDLQARLDDWLRDTPAWGPRLAAGSSSDPAEEVRAGRLLDRFSCSLSTLTIFVPPLRERRADLPWLVERMLERLGAGSDRKTTGLTPAAWELVKCYSWPGNLSELFAVLAGASRRAQGELIDVGALPASLRLALAVNETRPDAPERTLPLDRLLEQVERRLLLLALRQARGNKTRAAELLSIWRQRLLRRLEILGIEDSTR